MNNRHVIVGLVLFALMVMPISDGYASDGVIYKYDSLNRLVSAESNQFHDVYIYDAVGNRKEKYHEFPLYHYDEILIRFEIEVSDSEILSIVASQGGQILGKIDYNGEPDLYRIRMRDDQFGYTAVAQWRALPQVASVELHALRYPLEGGSPSPLEINIVRTGDSFNTIQEAYNAAINEDIIRVQAFQFVENIIINKNISVTIEGGYDEAYSAITGVTSIRGKIQTMPGGGVLNIKNIRIDTF